MVERTNEVLSQLRDLVNGAKAVPMSASCMVNRAEVLALIDRAAEALTTDVGEAQRVTATSLETLERAQEEAAQIIASAEEKANFLAGQTPVMETARKKAAQLEARALADAEALRREADAYVDARIASFEASLQKTMSQVRTMRDRLASRSSLDDTSTQALPRLQA
jgi:cell division septum initiation protein DivIVA